MEIGIALAILGILVSVVFASPVWRSLTDGWWYWRNRIRWTPDLQVDKGLIPKHRYYAFELWDELISVDASGNATRENDCRIANVSESAIAELTLPVYGDGALPAEAIAPWARQGKKDLRVDLEDWIPEKARGRVRIFFDPPVVPGKRVRFRWGYSFPGAFAAGDEWYSYDVATRHSVIRGKLDFDKRWRILYARWRDNLSARQPEVVVNGNVVEWKVWFPDEGTRITIDLGLATRKDGQSAPHVAAQQGVEPDVE
ncbi:MAG: hypothetical protein ACQGVC_11805 [Myxococcota bacterium]